ncbi:retrovirus-related pol polyprotein from transposon TNT 1-94 [Tanacetum coccineum]
MHKYVNKRKHRAQDQKEIYKSNEEIVENVPLDDDNTNIEGLDLAEGSAIWDIFHREDTSKLELYLNKHFIEFRHIYCLPLQQELNHGLLSRSLEMLSLYLLGRQNRGQGNNPRGAGAAGNGGVHNRVGNANPGQARQIKCYNCNGIRHIARNCTQPKRPQNSDYFKDKMLLMQAQENGVALVEEQLLFLVGDQYTAIDEDMDEPPVQDLALNVDNVFQADECDAFDSDVDEAPTTQTMFMENLSSADPVYDEASPSYYSDILSEVYNHDNYQDAVWEHHEVHEMHDDVQPNCLVDSDAEYMGDSNMISYDEYVNDNAEPVVQNNVSSVPNDAYMMIINEMHDQTAQCVSMKV